MRGRSATWFRALLTAAAVLVLSMAGIQLARELTKVWTMVRMGDIWSFFRLSENAPSEITEVDPADFPSPPMPKPGDLLLKVEGMPADRESYFQVFNVETEPGTDVELVFAHEGDTLSTVARTRSIPLRVSVPIVVLFLLRALLALSFIALALVALGSDIRLSAPVATLILFCLSMSAEVLVNRIAIADTYATFELPLGPNTFYTIGLAFSIAVPSLWLLLSLLFPRKNRSFARHQVLGSALIFLPPAALYTVILMHGIGAEIGLAPVAYMILFFAMGYWELVRSYRGACTNLEKRQTQLVMLGALPGLVYHSALNLFVITRTELYAELGFQLRLLIQNVDFLLLLLIPVSLALAIRRYRLLELKTRIRRGARFMLINVFLLAVMGAVMYGFGRLLLSYLNVDSQTPTLILGLALATGFVPAHRRVRHYIEERLYPERQRLGALLRNMLRTEMEGGPAEFWSRLREVFEEGLGVDNLYPLLLHSETGGLVLFGEEREETPFSRDEGAVRSLLHGDHPILVDEALASGRIGLSDREKQWLRARRISLLMPLQASHGVVGVLALPEKMTGEDFSSREMELLDSVTDGIALAAENSRLFLESVERHRLAEQVDIARRIQQGLLPGELPETPGLDLAHRMRFCLEVAGDYFDVVPMPDGSTVVAVGDVAGKGVGPALLMANLQASLRTALDVEMPLEKVVGKINSLVYRNTEPEMFITFFAGRFDPRDGSFTYVNAGHNPPLLIRSDCSVERLSRGGLLLGYTGEVDYRSGTVTMQPGEKIIMYTDGVTEAMDASERELGEGEIVRAAGECMSETAGETADRLESLVLAHHGSEDLYDDMTLLVLGRK
ncbi:MAG: SpoIIE family protein phosphatase [Candidatus Fermentibacteraceae bacterium]